MSVCRWIVGLFVLAYVAALAILAIGAFGWFGQERNSLAGVYVAILGLPWAGMLEGVSEPLRPWAAAATPLANLAILQALCLAAKRIAKKAA